MKAWCVALVLFLTACQRADVIFELDIEPNSVVIPKTTTAHAPLQIRFRAWSGSGCESFERLEIQRTASSLRLRALGRKPSNPLTACPAVVQYFPVEYTDPGTPARVHPFEVQINGQTFSIAVEP